MNLSQRQIQIIYFVLLAACFLPFISPALALLIGIGLSLLGLKHQKMSSFTAIVLQASIVLMGFGMNLSQVVQASKSGFEITAISVIATISLGLLLGKLLKVDHKISVLIAAGTAHLWRKRHCCFGAGNQSPELPDFLFPDRGFYIECIGVAVVPNDRALLSP